MSYGMEQKRAAAGGYVRGVRDDETLSAGAFRVDPKPGSADVVVNRVRSLLRTWEQFGTGDEATAIKELRKAVDGPRND